MSSEDYEWEKFYGKFRNEEPLDDETTKALGGLIDQIMINDPTLEPDDSGHLCVVIEADKWLDIRDFLIAMDAPIPSSISVAPKFADPVGMSKTLTSDLD